MRLQPALGDLHLGVGWSEHFGGSDVQEWPETTEAWGSWREAPCQPLRPDLCPVSEKWLARRCSAPPARRFLRR